MLGLAITDQFIGAANDRYIEAQSIFQGLRDPYERLYYTGLLHERHAKTQLVVGYAPHVLLPLVEEAMRCFADQLVVVTLGERGALAISGDRTVEQTAFAVRSIDSTGAGDAFVAGFVCGRWWTDGLSTALRLGCAAGALATTVAGAQPAMPRRSSVLDLLASDQAPDQGG